MKIKWKVNNQSIYGLINTLGSMEKLGDQEGSTEKLGDQDRPVSIHLFKLHP